MVKTKIQKQQEAVQRQEAHDALTIAERIAKAKKAPGKSTKELAKLQKKAA